MATTYPSLNLTVPEMPVLRSAKMFRTPDIVCHAGVEHPPVKPGCSPYPFAIKVEDGLVFCRGRQKTATWSWAVLAVE
jgi:hypothetical protein